MLVWDSLRPVAALAGAGAAAAFLAPGATSAALGLRVAGMSAGPAMSRAFLEVEDCSSWRAWAAGGFSR